MGKGQTHHRVTRFHQGAERSGVRLSSRVRLHICVVGGEQLPSPNNRETLNLIDMGTSAIVATARISLGILVCQYRTLRLKHGDRREVLRCDHLQCLPLTRHFLRHEGVQLGICVHQRHVEIVVRWRRRSAT